MRVLAGDIGATSARLAIVEVDAVTPRLLHHSRYASRDYPGLAPIVEAFLGNVRDVPTRACFGVACPVTNGECRATNLSWTIDERSLAVEIGIPHTELINDLQAVGHGLPLLGAADVMTLQTGTSDDRGAIALIGAGTGLGQAFITRATGAYQVHPSEGGHTHFSAKNDLEWGLVRFLADPTRHVSTERVVSGPGLINIYRYLAATGEFDEQPNVRAELQSGDPAVVITEHALTRTDPLCTRALDVFVSAFGAQAGDLALTVMATGGVYVTGGIAPHILPKLLDGAFMTAFRNKGKLSDFLTRVPVSIILNPHVGLLGAAVFAIRL